MSQDEEKRNDPAFEIVEVNIATGDTTVVIQKGILGALSNQLINTSERRKGSGIIRNLGHTLKDCGNAQYGGDINETSLDPSLVTNVVDTEPQSVCEES